MKTLYKLLTLGCVCCVFAATAALTSCTGDNVGDLRLSGDCRVEALALDDYEGAIDLKSRTITVRLPEVYETSAMQLTRLTLSEGASCNVRLGDRLNMDAAQVLHVTNGDTYLDWTVRVLHDEARITAFTINDIYQGTIDQTAKTIVVYVPASENLSALVPTITYSQNATITPASGQAQDFSQPVTYKVKNNSAECTYTVTVIAIDKPKALFVGAAPSMNDLDAEARAACEWMLANIPGSLYASFADLEANAVELDECKVIWWHFHVDGGVDGHDVFVAKAPEALAAKNQLRQFYENGGALFLTRYAVNMPSFIGATGDDEWTTPNNCWDRTKVLPSSAAGLGTSISLPVRTTIRYGRTSSLATILTRSTVPMPVITSPTPPPSTTLVPTGATIPTMLLGPIARVLSPSVWVATEPSLLGNIPPATAREASSA